MVSGVESRDVWGENQKLELQPSSKIHFDWVHALYLAMAFWLTNCVGLHTVNYKSGFLNHAD